MLILNLPKKSPSHLNNSCFLSFKPLNLWGSAEESLLESFVKTLSEDLELEPSEKDAQGSFTLVLNEEQTFVLRELAGEFLFRARVAPLPVEKQEEGCTHVMRGNFLGQGTGRAILGLDEDEKFLTLSLSLPYDMDYKTFKLTLEEFANYLAYWQQELKQ